MIPVKIHATCGSCSGWGVQQNGIPNPVFNNPRDPEQPCGRCNGSGFEPDGKGENSKYPTPDPTPLKWDHKPEAIFDSSFLHLLLPFILAMLFVSCSSQKRVQEMWAPPAAQDSTGRFEGLYFSGSPSRSQSYIIPGQSSYSEALMETIHIPPGGIIIIPETDGNGTWAQDTAWLDSMMNALYPDTIDKQGSVLPRYPERTIPMVAEWEENKEWGGETRFRYSTPIVRSLAWPERILWACAMFAVWVFTYNPKTKEVTNGG